MTALRSGLLDELQSYVAADDREAQLQQRITAFVASQADAFARTLVIGHVTASAWIVDPSRTCALLIHHRKLGKWLQLGGHIEDDVDLRAAALREAREESGLRTLRFASRTIYDLDVHRIPGGAGEPAHDHYDVRFALEADPSEPLIKSAESHALAWVPLAEIERYGVDESVLRLARKTSRLTDVPLPVDGEGAGGS
jgi:8-oxo-dGTP pyrophosphatase MutT (NUDIX family)